MEKDTEKPPPGLQERHQMRLSGKATAFGLVLAFAITALLIPAVVKLPAWIDYEIVLLAWWGIWIAVLTTLLYQGKRVADDHALAPPRSWLGWWKKQEPMGKEKSNAGRQSTSSSGWGGGWYWSDAGGADAEGCLWVLGAIVTVIVLFFAFWFLIEVAIPLILFLLYLVPRGMLSHVINDRHHCKGRLGRSLSWALVWATLYTVPLAGVVWCVHFLLARDMQRPIFP